MKHYINTRFFKSRLHASGLTQAGLAKTLGVDPSAMSALFSGCRPLRLDEVMTVANYLKCTPEEVLQNIGIQLSGKQTAAENVSVPVLGCVTSKGDVEINKETPPAKRIEISYGVPDDTIAVQIEEGSGPFSWLAGAFVLFQEPRTFDPAAIGRVSIVKTTAGPTRLRRIKPGIRPGSYDLLSPISLDSDGIIQAATPVLMIMT